MQYRSVLAVALVALAGCSSNYERQQEHRAEISKHIYTIDSECRSPFAEGIAERKKSALIRYANCSSDNVLAYLAQNPAGDAAVYRDDALRKKHIVRRLEDGKMSFKEASRALERSSLEVSNSIVSRNQEAATSEAWGTGSGSGGSALETRLMNITEQVILQKAN